MTSTAKHVAIIMDGNGRWANERMLPRYHGHAAGAKAVEIAINSAIKNDIKFLTLFALSSENISRPQKEVSFLKKIFYKNLSERLEELHTNNIKIIFIGDLGYFDAELNAKMQHATELTKNNTGLVFTVALNYGGRWDIVQACNRIMQEQKQPITEEIFNSYLVTKDSPSPDILIRTGGEKRISNFLIWQLAYTELYFSPKYWPDFTEDDFFEALEFYNKCDRRFGKVKETLFSEEVI